MKQILKKIGKKTALAIVTAVIAGSGATMAAFAAIPHSVTGVISACYTNTTGALRVIDAENNESCTGSETLMTWSSATTDKNSAMLHLIPDPNDNASFIMDTARSRNILAANTLNLDGSRYLCIKVAFQPQVKVVNSDDVQVGGGGTADIRIPGPGSDFANGVESLCGQGFNVISFLNGSQVYPQSVLFSN